MSLIHTLLPTGRQRDPHVLTILFLSCLAAVSLAACRSGIDFSQPPDIVYGEDVCERCYMIINEARYAAAYVTEDGKAHLFDDIGGMFAYDNAAAGDVIVHWVHDYDTQEWLKAEEAHYVKADHITPMGFGIVAFADQERAEAWAAEQGGLVTTFDELLSNGP